MRAHALFAAVGLVVVAGCGSTHSSTEAQPEKPSLRPRSYVSGYFLLQFEGVYAGLVQSADDSTPLPEVVHPAAKEEVIAMRVPVESAVVDGWVRDYLAGRSPLRTGAIVAADDKLEAHAAREFKNAVITEVLFPAFDGASKDPAYVTVKFAPESSWFATRSGKVVIDEGPVVAASELGLKITGLDPSAVKRVESVRIASSEPSKIEMPNLKVTFSATPVPDWSKWLSSFVIDGDNGEDEELSGTIEFLTPNRTPIAFRVAGLHRCKAAHALELLCVDLSVTPESK